MLTTTSSKPTRTSPPATEPNAPPMHRRRLALPSPLRRAFRSAAALEAIRSHSAPTSSSSSDTDDREAPATLALYNYPAFAGAYAALAAHLFHRRVVVGGRLLVLPFSSVEPLRFLLAPLLAAAPIPAATSVPKLWTSVRDLILSLIVAALVLRMD